MAEDKNPEGRPPTDKEEVLRKLEPYLKSGLSINKALGEAQISSSTFYDIVKKDPEFSERINRFRQFMSIMANSAIVREIQTIIKKQNEEIKLDKDDRELLKWFVLNSTLTREEFGERKDISFSDPQEEMKKIDERIAQRWLKKEDSTKI